MARPRPIQPPPMDDLDHTLERVALAELRPHPRNYQRHPEEEIAHLMQSLTLHSVYRNVVTARDGTLLAGHGVVEAARRLGYTHLSVKRLDLDPHEPRALQIVVGDNEIARLALKQEDELVTLLQDLSRDDPAALLGTGFDEATLMALTEAQGLGNGVGTGDAGRDVEPQIDRAEELREQWGVEVGQVWTLGEHRVICGDCTKSETLALLMNDSQFRLLATSPPYGDLREYGNPITDWQGLAQGFMRTALIYAADVCDIVVNLGLLHKDSMVLRYWEPWLDACADMGWSLYGWYVWDKLHGMPGEWNGRLAPSHEWIFHFSQGHASAQKWIRTMDRQDLPWGFRQQDGSIHPLTSPEKVGQPYKIPDSVIRTYAEKTRGIHDLHPAVYPVDFISTLLQTWSAQGQVIYNPFLGSGTTLIACENLKRICYGAEISPAYVGVCLQRFKDLTGVNAVRVEG